MLEADGLLHAVEKFEYGRLFLIFLLIASLVGDERKTNENFRKIVSC